MFRSSLAWAGFLLCVGFSGAAVFAPHFSIHFRSQSFAAQR
jgi:hypothetical protein